MLFVYIYFSNRLKVKQLFYATISFLPFQTNISLCFYPQLLSSTQLFTLSPTNFTLRLYSLNTTFGFFPVPTCSSASTESYTVSINPTSNSLLYSKKSFNMEETKKLVPTHASQFSLTLWKRKSSTIFFIYYTSELNDSSISTEKNEAISNNWAWTGTFLILPPSLSNNSLSFDEDYYYQIFDSRLTQTWSIMLSMNKID
jgi:hypothetical protein